MYTGLFHTHSSVRYLVLLFLVLVVVKSLMGLVGKKPFTKTDDKLTLFLTIATHTQFAVGVILYFVSPFVQFNEATMKDATTRYWTVEHVTMMLIAVVLITVARSTSKKLPTDQAKHKRVFILTTLALIIIVVTIVFSGRGLIIPVRA